MEKKGGSLSEGAVGSVFEPTAGQKVAGVILVIFGVCCWLAGLLVFFTFCLGSVILLSSEGLRGIDLSSSIGFVLFGIVAVVPLMIGPAMMIGGDVLRGEPTLGRKRSEVAAKRIVKRWMRFSLVSIGSIAFLGGLLGLLLSIGR